MPFSWGSLLLTEVMGSWTYPPLSPPPPPLSRPSSLLIRMPERVAQTALTFCLLPLVSSQHSSQRAFWKRNSSRDILFTASPLLHGENWRPSCDPQGLTCWSLPPSAASSAAPFLLRHHVTFSSSSAGGGFLFSLPPCQSILQVKHRFLWKVLFYLWSLVSFTWSPSLQPSEFPSAAFVSPLNSCVPPWLDQSFQEGKDCVHFHSPLCHKHHHLVENYQLFVEWINMSPMLELQDSPRIRSSHEFTDNITEHIGRQDIIIKSHQKVEMMGSDPPPHYCHHQG